MGMYSPGGPSQLYESRNIRPGARAAADGHHHHGFGRLLVERACARIAAFLLKMPESRMHVRVPDAADQGDAEALQVVPRRQRVQDLDVAVVAGAARQVEHVQATASGPVSRKLIVITIPSRPGPPPAAATTVTGPQKNLTRLVDPHARGRVADQHDDHHQPEVLEHAEPATGSSPAVRRIPPQKSGDQEHGHGEQHHGPRQLEHGQGRPGILDVGPAA